MCASLHHRVRLRRHHAAAVLALMNIVGFDNRSWICEYIQDKINKTDVTGSNNEDKKWCPIGFEASYLQKQNLFICYKRKGPEYFSEFYKECTKNLFSLELDRQLSLSANKSITVWTEYRNVYPGGPFFDTRLTDRVHHEFEHEYTYQNKTVEFVDDLCIVADPLQGYMAVKCDQKHYRFCIVEPMAVDNDQVKEMCKDLEGSLAFSSPVPICLTVMKLGTEGIGLYETKKAENLCKEKGGSLLNQGWLYANHPRFEHKNYLIKSNYSLYDTKKTWSPNTNHNDGYYKYLIYDAARMAISKYYFTDIICERIVHSVTRAYIEITNENTKISMFSIGNLTVYFHDFSCLNDSPWQFTSQLQEIPEFQIDLTTYYDYGYFWCVYRNPITYEIKNTNKVLYIRDKKLMLNVYAVKLQIVLQPEEYSNPRRRKEVMRKTYNDYFGNVLQLSLNDMRVKTFYSDGQTFLFHVTIPSKSKTELPPSRGNVTLLQLRPLYFCNELRTEHREIIPRKPMNATVTLGCVTYTCAGDFNEGVQWQKDVSEHCKTSTPEQIVDDLQLMVSESVPLDNVTAVLHKVNYLFETKKKLKNPGRLLHLLDQLGSTVKLKESQRVNAIVGASISLIVANVNSNRHIWGLKMYGRNSRNFKNESFEFMTRAPDLSTLYSESNEVVVVLPASVATSPGRVSFVTFHDDGAAFSYFANHYNIVINSNVISVTVQNFTQFQEGEVINIYFKPIRTNIRRNESRTCAYWHFTGIDETSGYWSQEGCSFISAARPGLLDTCRCTHFTHFAEILIPRTVFSEKNENVLETISIIGCFLSILGLTMVAVTASMFRTWRREFCNKIWLQLCIPLLFRSICFLVIVFAKFDHYNIGCMLVGIALHYSVLCSFCWMLVAAVLSYRKLVIVSNVESSHKLLKACAFSYGFPCVVIGVLLSVVSNSYVGNFEETNPSGKFCYPSGLGLWLAVYAPIATMLLVNWTLFVLIFHSVFLSKRVQRYGESNEALRCVSVSCLLVFAFGLHWVSGLFANNIVAAFICNITASLQGFVLSMFFILGNAETRKMWLNKIKSTRKVL